MMRFKISGRLYTAASLTEVSLRDLLLFEVQTEEMGLPLRWADQLNISEEITALPKEERGKHPKMLQLLAVTVWATRRVAGDKVTFSEALDFSLDQLEWVGGGEDDEADPPKARQATRKGSGRAGASRATASKKGTSARKSTSASSS